jgi:hypothetical protein
MFENTFRWLGENANCIIDSESIDSESIDYL